MSVPGGAKVLCPYDKAHKILVSRIQWHLVKCARNHPHIKKYQICSFDATHFLRDHEIEEHHINCPSRAARTDIPEDLHVVEEAQAEVENPVEIELPSNQQPTNKSEDNWDDMDFASYDPQSYVQNAPILRTINLGTRSQRNQFRDTERQRMANFEKRHP